MRSGTASHRLTIVVAAVLVGMALVGPAWSLAGVAEAAVPPKGGKPGPSGGTPLPKIPVCGEVGGTCTAAPRHYFYRILGPNDQFGGGCADAFTIMTGREIRLVFDAWSLPIQANLEYLVCMWHTSPRDYHVDIVQIGS